MFKDEDFESLVLIECLKKTGMRIKDIKTFIDWVMEGDSTIDRRLDMFKTQKEAVEKQIAELQDACIWQVENDEFGNEKMQSLPSR
jgi:DNA-binding transcriptional MerR regulator